jgi:nitrile hydratase subunit beta
LAQARKPPPALSLPGPASLATGKEQAYGCVPVSRVHDIGGQTGFGPVPVGEDGQPFAADWEARVYALNGVLRSRGLYTTDEFRDAIERIPPAEYIELSYYERWLRAIETVLAERGLLAAEDSVQ